MGLLNLLLILFDHSVLFRKFKKSIFDKFNEHNIQRIIDYGLARFVDLLG